LSRRRDQIRVADGVWKIEVQAWGRTS